MIRFFRSIFRRKPAPEPIPCIHERVATNAWYDALLAMDEATPRATVRLGWPEFSHQGTRSRCTGEAIEGQANIMARHHGRELFPAIDAAEIYQAAKPRDHQPDHKGGSDLWAAAEAYCVLAGTGINWARMVLHPNVIRGLIRIPYKSPDGRTVPGRPVAFGAAFHETDFRTGVSGRVMLPSHGALGNHAMVLHEYHPAVSYRVNPFSARVSTSECFGLRNTNTPHDREPWLYPVWRMRATAGAIEAIILTLPGEPGFIIKPEAKP